MDKNFKDVVSQYIINMNNDERKFDFHDYSVKVTSTESIDYAEYFPEPDNSWSIIWYIASFSGLIAFFLIVSCSEWCCRLHIRSPNIAQTLRSASSTASPSSTSQAQASSIQVQESPPPAYDLFAPPSYESLTKAGVANSSSDDSRPSEKSEYDVYVVPVHAIGMLPQHNETTDCHILGLEDEPPSYTSVQLNNSNSLPR